MHFILIYAQKYFSFILLFFLICIKKKVNTHVANCIGNDNDNIRSKKKKKYFKSYTFIKKNKYFEIAQYKVNCLGFWKLHKICSVCKNCSCFRQIKEASFTQTTQTKKPCRWQARCFMLNFSCDSSKNKLKIATTGNMKN